MLFGEEPDHDRAVELRIAGVPEWLQKSALFEEEERDEWVGVYELAGLPWPAKYDIPGACCMPDGADAAAAQPGQAGPPLEPSHENPSRLARSESDMDIDDPALPVVPKMSLQAAIKSTPVVAQAAASGQSCGEWHCLLSASCSPSMQSCWCGNLPHCVHGQYYFGMVSM